MMLSQSNVMSTNQDICLFTSSLKDDVGWLVVLGLTAL